MVVATAVCSLVALLSWNIMFEGANRMKADEHRAFAIFVLLVFLGLVVCQVIIAAKQIRLEMYPPGTSEERWPSLSSIIVLMLASGPLLTVVMSITSMIESLTLQGFIAGDIDEFFRRRKGQFSLMIIAFGNLWCFCCCFIARLVYLGSNERSRWSFGSFLLGLMNPIFGLCYLAMYTPRG
jgi:hypothetical protein